MTSEFFSGHAGELGLKWSASTEWVPQKTEKAIATFDSHSDPFVSVMHYPNEKLLQEFHDGVA